MELGVKHKLVSLALLGLGGAMAVGAVGLWGQAQQSCAGPFHSARHVAGAPEVRRNNARNRSPSSTPSAMTCFSCEYHRPSF